MSSSEDTKDVMSNQKQLVKNVPELNANISTNIPSNVFQPTQISHLGPSSFIPPVGQVQQQPAQVLGPQVIQYTSQPQFFQAPQMQYYNSAVPQPIFQQIAPNYSSFQTPSIYMGGTPVVVQQPHFVAQQPQVQYLHQNIMTSTNTYNDGVNPTHPNHYDGGTNQNQQKYGN